MPVDIGTYDTLTKKACVHSADLFRKDKISFFQALSL